MSFLQLVAKSMIEIPVIQRDYVQGVDTPSIARVRDRFVDDLWAALTNLEAKSPSTSILSTGWNARRGGRRFLPRSTGSRGLPRYSCCIGTFALPHSVAGCTAGRGVSCTIRSGIRARPFARSCANISPRSSKEAHIAALGRLYLMLYGFCGSGNTTPV